MNIVYLGEFFGDEGKGKIVDASSENARAVVRFQGGHNAGHTLVVDDITYKLHNIPSGIVRGLPCIIGNGCVVDQKALLTNEIATLEGQGIVFDDNLIISNKAHVILPIHRYIEGISGAGKQRGTTGRGIGPAYSFKIGRWGIRFCDLESGKNHLQNRLGDIYDAAFLSHDGGDGFPALHQEVSKQLGFYERLKQKARFCNTVPIINELADGEHVVFEGAQATLLDIDHGTYPDVTSSTTTIGGVFSGTGLGHGKIDKVVLVTKAYSTRVGNGVYITRDTEREPSLRQRGNEYGTSTGRDRNCGWFDGVAARYAVMINGADSVAVTKLDVLDAEPTVRLCVGYYYKGSPMKDYQLPDNPNDLEHCTPRYRDFEGWNAPTSGVTDFDDLPAKAQDYLKAMEDVHEVLVNIISTGPQRHEIIYTPQGLGV